MSLSNSVEESLKEAESNLRNALAFAARQEKPFVSREISELICKIDNLRKADKIIDKIENRMKDGGDNTGMFGTFFG
jgi:hypothetical protein